MKTMNLRTLTLALALIATFSLSAKASLIDFTFSFTADAGAGIPGGSTDLTVTGRIIGLDYNGGFDTSAPTSIIIDSMPAYFGGITLGTPLTGSSAGTFTVDPSGQIVAANDFYTFTDGSHVSYIQFNYGATNELYENSGLHIYNSDGFAGATYTLTSAVPEPSQYGWGVALALIGFVGFRKFSARKTALSA